LKKLDDILKQNKEIKEFKTFDVDSEWNSFLTKVGETSPSVIEQNTAKNKSPLSIIFRKPAVSIISIAASLVLILGALFIFKKPEPYRSTVITTDNIKKINMIDGSKIELSQNSKLEFPLSLENLRERKVILSGSAVFDVVKNETLPYRVYYGEILVEVLGTEFAINKRDGLTIIQNISGSVAVSQVLNRSNKKILQQGETLLFQYGKFFLPQDTVQITVNEKDSTVVEKKVISNKNFIKDKRSTFKLDNVVKNYLLKFYKKKIKVQRGTKFDKKTTVKLDMNKSYQEILVDLKKQGQIDFKPGDCEGCFIITAPAKKQ
jgi:archaellum component FlaF (FlaF/FlaG flagellin family)